MKQRTDFWEWYEQLFRTPQVISQEVKAPVSKTGNAGSNPASSAKIKRAFSPDESLGGMSKPAPECAVGLALYSIGRREGLEEGIKPGLQQVLKRKEKA